MRILFTDGGSTHNGSASQRARIAVFDEAAGSIVVDRDLGNNTNNEAEYKAILAALTYARDTKLGSVEIRSDSQLCVYQIMGQWKVKEARLALLADEARQSLRANGGKIVWVRREENKAGHYLEFGQVRAGIGNASAAVMSTAEPHDVEGGDHGILPVSNPPKFATPPPSVGAARDGASYCIRCGNSLTRRVVDHRERRSCIECGWTHFDDPKVATAAIVSIGGCIVLCRRAIEPGIGKWSFPAGYVDRGEVIEDALRREVREEVGLDAIVDRLVGVYSQPNDPVVLIVYAAHATGEPRVVGVESTEVGLFQPDAIPEMAFARDQRIVAEWRTQ